MRSIRRLLAVPAVLVAASLAGAQPAAGATIEPQPPLIQAHRGGPALGAPENTIALFRLAIASGVVDRIETDVRATGDGVLVIHHNVKLATTCSAFGGTALRDLTWAQLSTVTCQGEPIPRVTDALEVVRGTAMTLNLELKLDEAMTSSQKTAFAKKVAQTVVKAGLAPNQVSVSSYYWRSYARAIKDYGQGLRMTAMEFEERTDPDDNVFATVRRAKADGVDALSFSSVDAHRDLLAFIRDYGRMEVGLGDRAGEADTRYALAYGLRTFTTDDPVETRELIDALYQRVADKPLELSLKTTAVTPKVFLSARKMAKNTKLFPIVVGTTSGRLDPAAVKHLDGIVYDVKVKGSGAGKLELAPSGSRPGTDGKRIAIPKGTKTFQLVVGPGDGGRLRVYATGAATVTVTMTGYRTSSY